MTRILTTHIGSLPRPDDLAALLRLRDAGSVTEGTAFEARVRSAVDDVVHRQVTAGLDIVNDGEQSKPDYSTYIKDRLTGFEGEPTSMPAGADLKDFPAYAARTRTAASERRPTCSGPLAWRDFDAVERDIRNLAGAAAAAGVKQAFMTAVSPG
ncbi:MAG: hypothetical protein ACREF4_17730, partial [Gammaproteobacteria bacterium]